MNEEKIVKIHTKKGRIITLTVLEQDDFYIEGHDKFGEYVKLPMAEIDTCLPYYQHGGTI